MLPINFSRDEESCRLAVGAKQTHPGSVALSWECTEDLIGASVQP